jgi:hypothetical protein
VDRGQYSTGRGGVGAQSTRYAAPTALAGARFRHASYALRSVPPEILEPVHVGVMERIAAKIDNKHHRIRWGLKRGSSPRPARRRNEVAPRPESVAKEIGQLAFHILRNPDRAFTVQIPEVPPTLCKGPQRTTIAAIRKLSRSTIVPEAPQRSPTVARHWHRLCRDPSNAC